MNIKRAEFRVLVIGLAACVFSQYAWMAPVPYLYLILCGVAFTCATIALLMEVIKRVR